MKPLSNTPEFSPTAQWIWDSATATEPNQWRYFRSQFQVPAGTLRATLLITADSHYECSFNEHFLGRGPVRGFPFDYPYDIYDVTPYLQAGQSNVLAVLANHLGDHTFTYIRGKPGLLCELVCEDAQGNVTRHGSDANWRTAVCRAFNAAAPRISVQLGFEEQYDARQELLGWDALAYDDSAWAHATEIGPVGSAPWTTLSPRTIPFLTEDWITPTEVKAVELARVAPGVFWNLDVRYEAGTVRTGLRSAPPGERGSILFTDLIAPHAGTLHIHNFPNYETLALRVNDQFFEAVDRHDLSGEPLAVTLCRGSNLVMLKTMATPGLLFETADEITFSADRFVPGAAWVLVAPLNEQNGELDAWWHVTSLDALPGGAPRVGIPAGANKTDIFALTASQKFFAIDNGFCAYEITRATPRPKRDGVESPAIRLTDALLHDNADWTTIYPQSDGDLHVVLDFGRELIGYVQIELNAPAGAIVDANFFEGIDDSGIFWTLNLRNSFRYVCREGLQTFVSHERRGFRYGSFTFRNMTRPIQIRQIGTRLSTYPVKARGQFRCSDETLTKIWEVAAYTVRLCMLDTYVDCPAYEQVYWVGDARNSALVNAVAFGAFDLTDRSIRLAGESLSEKLSIVKPPHLAALRTHITTSHTVSGWFDEIPMWTFLWIWMAWENYWLTGDIDALAAYYSDVRECLARAASFLSPRGLLDIPDIWNLVDWAAQDLERDGEVISNTVLMAQALDRAAQMANALGLNQEAVQHTELATRLRAAVNKYGWSDEYQGYVDTVRDGYAYEHYQQLCTKRGLEPESFEAFRNKQRISEPTNTLALLCNAVPAGRYDSVMRFVLAAKQGKFVGSSPMRAQFGRPDEIVPVGSPWFLFFTLEALFQEGYADDALSILREQWNRMLEKGATTFWETFPGFRQGHWSRSLCHGWSAAPAYFLSTQVLGITPLSPGYERIRIAPQAFDLQWASGTVPTPRGEVSVAWHLNASGAMEIEYHVPKGCEVELISAGAGSKES